MTHFYKIAISIVASLISFSILYVSADNLTDPIVYSSITFVVFLLIFYGEGRIYPKLNSEKFFFSTIGLILGLIVAFFLSQPFKNSGNQGTILILNLIFGLFGIKTGLSLTDKPGFWSFFSKNGNISPFPIGAIPHRDEIRDKILDTSVVIDGRILDIADTHFIDGPLVLPNFVLREIQLISDSSDPIKRARGRRGLDMLNKLQRKGTIEVKITYTDYTDTREVDAKLIKLARDTNAKLVTNDFNLNKVAELQGVQVLNLNNLANALKPVVLPGEEFIIQVIKEGKDENQGIGYMEDGTMVVIENGGHLVGKDVRVGVTSIIQTAAGKMIFTKVLSNRP